MKAKILPLKGKYYGTEVIIEYDGDKEYYIKLWGGDDRDEDNYKPSERELSKAIDTNILDGDFSCDLTEYIDFSHMESVTTYRIAKLIVDVINNEY